MFLFRRNGYYYIEYFDEIEDRKKRVSTKSKTKYEALSFLSEFEKQIKVQQKLEHITLMTFKNEYEKFIQSSYSSKYYRSVELSFRMLINFVDDMPLVKLNSKHLEKFITTTLNRSKSAASLYYRTIKAGLNKAVVWRYILDNPIKKVKLPKAPKKLPVFISPKELQKIIDVTKDQVLRDIYNFAFNTGMRLNEILNIKWSHIDMLNKKIKVSNSDTFVTKNKKERIIPINSKLFDMLNQKSERESETKYVFTNKLGIKFNDDYISKQFKKCVYKAKVNYALHFHSLRHGFASLLVQKGVPLYVVKELLGHEDIKTTQIYCHLTIDVYRNVTEVLANN